MTLCLKDNDYQKRSGRQTESQKERWLLFNAAFGLFGRRKWQCVTTPLMRNVTSGSKALCYTLVDVAVCTLLADFFNHQHRNNYAQHKK